jgi:hypothetical protein
MRRLVRFAECKICLNCNNKEKWEFPNNSRRWLHSRTLPMTFASAAPLPQVASGFGILVPPCKYTRDRRTTQACVTVRPLCTPTDDNAFVSTKQLSSIARRDVRHVGLNCFRGSPPTVVTKIANRPCAKGHTNTHTPITHTHAHERTRTRTYTRMEAARRRRRRYLSAPIGPNHRSATHYCLSRSPRTHPLQCCLWPTGHRP